MKKIFSLTFVLCLVFLAFSSVSNVLAQTKKIKINDTQEKSAALLYEISGNGLEKPSYLFGTIHIICSEDMISAEKLNNYIAKTDQIFLELDLDDPAVMGEMTKALYLKDGKTLSDFLTNEQLVKVGELVKNYLGVPIENVKNFHPLILSTMITTSPKVLGCSPPGSYELSFIQAAGKQKKPIEGLETIEEELKAINSKPLSEQAKTLYEMALDPEKSTREFKVLIETYKMQDSDKIYKIMQKFFADDPNFQVNLLDNRNLEWLPKIEKAVKDKPSFIAVGAGHLGGEKGVINLLKEEGYTLKAIKL